MIAICLIAIVWIALADDDGDDLRKSERERERDSICRRDERHEVLNGVMKGTVVGHLLVNIKEEK